MNLGIQSEAERLPALVQRLRALSHETEWLEFKENKADPEDIGEYISALSNGAALNNQSKGYLIWGIRDSDHAIVGTNFKPQSKKIGNEDLLPWLTRLISPQVHFKFHELEIEGKRVVVLEIAATHSAPVRFKDFAGIRIGSHKKKLSSNVDYERRLWNVFNQTSFEENIAMPSVDAIDVIELIDYSSYHRLLKRRHAEQIRLILENLESDSIVRKSETDAGWDITNLGAMLFARDIKSFPSLERKALRIVHYKGSNRIETIRETVGVHGYATGFEGAAQYLNSLLPAREIIGEALRNDGRMFPELAIRELLANALIHQDFTQTGNGPMVEIFDHRVEITSPGRPLIDPARFLDLPPKSRNEKLASMLRRAGICEERGSGWDKIAFEVELKHLPAPLVLIPGANTKVILYGPKSFQEMDKEERLRAIYLHACLRYVEGGTLTNASFRARFEEGTVSVPAISKVISDAVQVGIIAPVDPTTGRRYMKYLPGFVAHDSTSL